jgi:hypothetical protein
MMTHHARKLLKSYEFKLFSIFSASFEMSKLNGDDMMLVPVKEWPLILDQLGKQFPIATNAKELARRKTLGDIKVKEQVRLFMSDGDLPRVESVESSDLQ